MSYPDPQSLPGMVKKIENRTARLGVIGLGYIGLPLAATFAEAGFSVLGIERQAERAAQINQGLCPLEGDEPGLAELIEAGVASSRLRASTEYRELAEPATPYEAASVQPASSHVEVVFICVETPVDRENIPQYQALRSALIDLGKVLQPGTLVIVESTLAPGSMRDLVAPLLAATSGLQPVLGAHTGDFYLGHCPERVMPGKLLHNLHNVGRVVGGMNPETAAAMAALYQHVVKAELVQTDCLTAELVKTVENAYRDVQIAFANEVALICEAVGGDVWQVRELVNKSPYRAMHLPGAGVGGHCIPKDPWLLAYSVQGKDIPLRLIPAARAINESMPMHMAELTIQALAQTGKNLSGAHVLLMGYAYLENSGDTRNSPSAALAERLKQLGATVAIHDPYVAEYANDLLQVASGCDAAIVMVRHREYLKLDLKTLKSVMRTPVMVDGRLVYDGAEMQAQGWIYRAVGQASSGSTLSDLNQP